MVSSLDETITLHAVHVAACTVYTISPCPDEPCRNPAGLGDGASDVAVTPSGGSIVAEWRENLAIMAANRTRDDERVMQRLGDRLWDERGEVRECASGFQPCRWVLLVLS